MDKHVKISGFLNSDSNEISKVIEQKPNSVLNNNISFPTYTNANTDKDFDPNHNNVIVKKRTLKSIDLFTVNNATDVLDNQFGDITIFSKENEKVKDLDKEKENIDILPKTKSTNDDKNPKDAYDVDTIPPEVDKATPKNNTNFDLGITVAKSKVKFSDAKTHEKSNAKESESSLSNFFMKLSNWFSALDEMETSAKNLSKVIPR